MKKAKLLRGGSAAHTLNPMHIYKGKQPRPPKSPPPSHAHLSFQQWAVKHSLVQKPL